MNSFDIPYSDVADLVERRNSTGALVAASQVYVDGVLLHIALYYQDALHRAQSLSRLRRNGSGLGLVRVGSGSSTGSGSGSAARRRFGAVDAATKSAVDAVVARTVLPHSGSAASDSGSGDDAAAAVGQVREPFVLVVSGPNVPESMSRSFAVTALSGDDNLLFEHDLLQLYSVCGGAEPDTPWSERAVVATSARYCALADHHGCCGLCSCFVCAAVVAFAIAIVVVLVVRRRRCLSSLLLVLFFVAVLCGGIFSDLDLRTVVTMQIAQLGSHHHQRSRGRHVCTR